MCKTQHALFLRFGVGIIITFSVSCFFFLSLFIVGEACARLYYQERYGDATVGVISINRFAPYHMYSHNAGGASSRVNADGFCARDFSTYREKSDTLRIILVGGSVASSYGGPSGKEPWFFEKIEDELARQTGKPVQVINLAVGGFVARQEYLVLLRFGRLLQPDIVISFDGINDLHHALIWNEHPGTPCNFANMEQWFSYADEGWLGVAKSFRRQSMFLFFLGNQLAKIHPPAEDKVDTRVGQEDNLRKKSPKITEEYVEAIELMTSYCHMIGARHLATLQPCALIGKELTPEEIHRQMSLPQDVATLYTGTYADFSASLRSAERVGKVDCFLDLTSSLSDSKASLYSDHCHFNLSNQGYNQAYDLITREIVAYIGESNLLALGVVQK